MRRMYVCLCKYSLVKRTKKMNDENRTQKRAIFQMLKQYLTFTFSYKKENLLAPKPMAPKQSFNISKHSIRKIWKFKDNKTCFFHIVCVHVCLVFGRIIFDILLLLLLLLRPNSRRCERYKEIYGCVYMFYMSGIRWVVGEFGVRIFIETGKRRTQETI